ncbi:hypothetical protein ACTHOQ_10600 [Solibacillus silvestris]|uniref:hypothetical protein n=1 Tax=Solibacillus silvestris TaxID=76853 RepID=UPI003F7D458E
MSHFEEVKEEALPIEKILKHFMKQQFSTAEEDLQENNNSFIFLEKSSLNILLAYLLSNKKNEASETADEKLELKALEKINQVIHDNEKQFKAIINLLKEVT